MSANNPRHSRFFWRSSAMFCILDTGGQFKEVNSAWEKTLGLSTGQLLAKSFVDFVHPEDRPATQYYLEQLQSGMVSTSFSARFRHQNGAYRTILWEFTSAASQEYAFYAVGMDISSREKPSIAEEMISVIDEGVVLQYANGTIGVCNPSAERILGLPVDQMIGWTFVDPDWRIIREDSSIFPSETHPAICTLRTGQPYSDVVMGIEKPDGTVLWLRVSATPLWRDDVTTPYAVVVSFADITQFKETEIALRKTSSEQGAVPMIVGGANSTDYDLWDWNLENNQVNFSSRWKQMLGYTDAEVVNHVDSWHERIHPVDYKRVLADVQNHLEGLTPQFENTHRLQHKDGSYRWVLCRGKAVTDARGKPIRIVGMHIDVTDQRRGEDRTHEVQGKYYQLLETESNGVFLVDAESEKILETNKSASQIYGYNKQEFLSLKFGDLSAQSEKTRKSLKKLAKYTRQRYHKKKDGSVFPVEMTVSPFVLQGRDMLMVICKDNTEQQKIETALWESQSKYRQLFEAASNAIIVFDANTQQVFDVNSAAMDLYGYTKEEWMHLTTEDLSAEPVKSRAAFYTGNKRFQVIPLRWHKKRDGGVFPVEISTGSSYLFQGRSLVCATLRDITERKEAEEALRKEKDFINTLVQSSPTFFVAINPDGKIRMMNKAMLLALSYALEEVVDRDFLTTCVPANEHSVVKTEFDALTKSMRPSMIECHLLPRQGTPLLVEWHSRAIVQPDGSLDYLFGVGINVTERAETQANLRLFKAIIDASEEAISISDAQGNLVYINPSHIKLFGKTLEEFNADKKSYYPPESQEIVNREVVPTLARGQSWTGELDVRDSHDNIFPIWQRVEAVRDANGKILYSFKLMHDISERKRMWETLRGQWEEYQLIFNSVPLMIWHRDKENRLLRANKLALEVFGDEDEAKDFFEDNQEIMETGEPRHGIIEFTPPGAQNRRRLQTGRIPYRDKNGEIIGIIVFALDITEYQSGGSGGNSIADILRPFLENSPLMLVALDANGRIIAWNHAAENATGFTAKEITRHTKALEILFPDVKHRQRVLERLRKPGSDYRDWESMVMTKEGNLRPVSWTSLAARFPVQGWHFWLVGMDIGSKHKVDKALLEKDTLLPYIFNMVRIGIAVTDDRGRFVKVNPAYAEIYGCPIEELIGQPFTYILPPKMHDDAIREYFSILVSNEEATFARRIEQQRSGAPFEAGIISSRIILEDGRRLLMTVVTRVTAPK